MFARLDARLEPSLFAASRRPAPLLGVMLCASGFTLSALLMFAELFGAR
jgi:hypothetical protein